MHYDLPRLHAINSARREVRGPHGLDGVETFKRLQYVKVEVERRLPGGSRWISGWRPFVDHRGHWNPGALISTTGPRPLRISECYARLRERERAW